MKTSGFLNRTIVSLSATRHFEYAEPYRGELAGCDVSDSATIKKFVPPMVKDLLAASDLAIERTRAVFPHGAGNLQDTLHSSRLKSYLHLANRRTSRLPARWESRDYREMVAHDAATSIATGGGNCSEYAHVAAMELNKVLPLGTPIRVCNLTWQDHVLVMVGNHLGQDPQNCVIVDAWPSKSQAVCAADYGFLSLEHWGALAQFEADGTDMPAGLLERVRNPKNMPALNAEPLSLADLEAPTRLEYWSVSHVTRGNLRIDYQADPSLPYTNQLEKYYFADTVDHTLDPSLPFSAQCSLKGVGLRPHFVQLNDNVRLNFSNPRHRYSAFTEDACALVRLGISKRVDTAWAPQRWSVYEGGTDYHLETQWGVLDPMVESLCRTGRLTDDWRRVCVVNHPVSLESITRYNPQKPFCEQVFFSQGETSDLLLSGNRVLECRAGGYGDVFDADTPLLVSVLQYGEGLIEALDLSWVGRTSESWYHRTTAGQLDTLLPQLEAWPLPN